MSWGIVAGAAATVVGGVLSSNAQKSAANQASQAQIQSAQLGVDEQRRQFDAVQKLLAPYVNAGTGALTQQQNLLGLNGGSAQQQAIAGIQSSPQFNALKQSGEQSILANASATGGLRGGNVQGALAQFSPNLLSQLIEQQYGRLGGISSMGQASAAGVGSAGMQTGQGIANLLQQQGAAQAGNALAEGKAQGSLYGGIGSAIGQLGSLYASGAFNRGGGGSGGAPTNELF